MKKKKCVYMIRERDGKKGTVNEAKIWKGYVRVLHTLYKIIK